VTAPLMLSEAGELPAAAEDKAFTLVLRRTLLGPCRPLPAYIFIDCLSYASSRTYPKWR